MKGFGILLCAIAAACCIGAIVSSQETGYERLLDSNARESEMHHHDLGGSFFKQSAESSRSRLAESKSSRNQATIIWIAVAGIFFLSGIICISNSSDQNKNNSE